eukprot:SAG11_NODE_10681_length_812_cov_1.336606_1_plen_172_part_01
MQAIPVVGAAQLPTELAAMHQPVGQAGDYKPWLVQLANGEILLACYNVNATPAGAPRTPASAGAAEHAIFFRSTDQGRSFGRREARPDLPCVEPTLTVASTGTVLLVRASLRFGRRDGPPLNPRFPYYGLQLFRSADHARTFSLIVRQRPADGGLAIPSAGRVVVEELLGGQ